MYAVEYFPLENCVIGGSYRIVRKIRSGGHSEVYLGMHVKNGEKVAIKIEHRKSQHQQLIHEWELYKILQGGCGVPRIRWYGQESCYNVLVMDLLGPSLQNHFESCSRRFSMKTVLMLADQLIDRIEHIHSKNLLHNDIKPENMLMGLGCYCHRLYLIDFGLAKRYRYSTGEHVRCFKHKHLILSSWFSSINAHLGVQQTRRDDLESIGYVLMYFLRGELPWQGLKTGNSKQMSDMIRENKMNTSVKTLCNGYPSEFAKYLNYCRNLRFDELPNYYYLRCMFRILLESLNHRNDHVFDWVLLERIARTGRKPSCTSDDVEDIPSLLECTTASKTCSIYAHSRVNRLEMLLRIFLGLDSVAHPSLEHSTLYEP